MKGKEKALLYEDNIGFGKPGHVYYPEALRLISPFLAELNSDEILEPKSFNANIQLYLDHIIGHFQSFHDTHAVAKEIYSAYRTQKKQYCLYLRSFTLAGMALHLNPEGDRLTQTIGYSANDRNYRRYLKASLVSTINCLSFINTFDLYPSGNELDRQFMKGVTIPSFRVLSHNWKTVVRQVIHGAKFIVMNMEGDSEGVAYELAMIKEAGMTDRTILIRERQDETGAGKAFYDVIDLKNGVFQEDSEPGRKLAKAIHSLCNDGFEQSNKVTDLTNLPCWVVDRQIDLAARSFDKETLAGISYDLYIPSSLASNWELLTESFPIMNEQWQAIEGKIGVGQKISTDELAKLLYSALRVFYIGATVERYYEMSIAISTLGMAHRMITNTLEIMFACYEYATKCAGWLGDLPLRNFFSNASVNLAREIAAKK
jgi:hypothetical protein